jgi:2-oxoisovalerate dehydrogenase E1 component
MAVNRAGIVDQNFVALLRELPPGPARTDLDSPVREGTALTARRAIALFTSQVESRHLDLAARALKARNECFYTIGSSGHEGNAAVAAALRPDDPAFLHYRSGAFFVERARQVPGSTPVWDVLLGLTASSEEPIAGGRHKVFGSFPLAIPPQTSTIASHLPKAVGMALAIERGKRIGLTTDDDRIVVCTYGDASNNHSTAQGAINAAEWHAHQGRACPILFVCEDNGIGISTPTPEGWVATQYGNRANLAYVPADGLDLPDVADAAEAAVRWVRQHRQPCLLHVRTVRLLGHAGSDVESTYRSPDEIAASEARDPLLRSAALLVAGGWLTPAETVALYEDTRARVAALAEEAIRRPKLRTAAEVIAPLAPRRPDAIAAEVLRPTPEVARSKAHHGQLPEADKPRHLAVQINRALADLFVKYPEMSLFGEDVGKKGGVYHVTADLQKRFGADRVIDTLLDEQTILGIALGAGQAGQLPFPEIQYLAYFHNACDQIRGEAASLRYFSNGQFTNPMVCRIAGYAYQKGFGGHFHNDNSIAALRDIPGLIIASPARGDDAAGMLRTCAAAAKVDGAVCLFLEPIALYMTRDLHADGDGEWATAYPPLDVHVPLGRARTYGEGTDLTILTWANGLWMSLRAARRLEADGISCRVVDLRWILPLPTDDLVREARATGRVLVVDECRATGGVSEGIYTALIDAGVDATLRRVAGQDVYIPLGGAANLVLVQEDDIFNAAKSMFGGAS